MSVQLTVRGVARERGFEGLGRTPLLGTHVATATAEPNSFVADFGLDGI